jgi:solute:Na+ symporter, SSS family
MTWLDWVVLVCTVGFIAIYGAVRTRGVRDMEGYFRGAQKLRWPTIGLSIMATQASAITFLSTPGQAYEDGMRFVQFYFGLPLAMVVISAVFVPIFHRLKVYTAYEYLEHRFDARVRYLGALLFSVQRGLSAGVTIYAPSILLSSILGWPLQATNLGVGLIVIAYTVGGGVDAVSRTQKQQMVVMLSGMLIALCVIIWQLPPEISLPKAVRLAGALGRMNSVSFDFDLANRYNFWSGLSGGFFLALAYFGTDQSQVQRYLSGRSVTESRLGLLFNGMFKVPMQALILFSGVMMFVFYLFSAPPLFFNQGVLDKVAAGPHAGELHALEQRHAETFGQQRTAALAYAEALDGQGELEAAKQRLKLAAAEDQRVRDDAKQLIKRAQPEAELKDADYVFLGFVLRYLPSGLVGLLIAVILCAAMSSVASELTALGSTSTLDLYQRWRGEPLPPERGLWVSKLFTALWGLVAVAFASFAALLDNLIEAVNIMGSLFYGTQLGLFLVGFFVKGVGSRAVLLAALVAQASVLGLFFGSSLGFLWYNVVGSLLVVGFGLLFQRLLPPSAAQPQATG